MDLSKLEDLRALDRPGNEGFLKKIATLFLKDAGRRLEEIEGGLDASDAAAVRMASHTLKGSCSYLGATRLAELCRVMEERADQGDLDSGRGAIETIRAELAEVSAVLNEEIDKD